MVDRNGRPVLLAIGGDSGSGKTTIARGLYNLFGRENVVSICLDDYHKLDRRQRQQAGVTALNPAANDIELMEEQIWALREGRPVLKPVYDHSTGTFGQPELVEPRPWIVIRGLFPLFSERLRQAFDVRVWLDPEDELKYHWKVQRDVAQRGYTVEQVIRHIVERQDDLRRYILPQREHADIVVRFFTPPGYFQAIKEGRTNGSLPQLPVKLTLKSTAPAPGVAEVLAEAAQHGGDGATEGRATGDGAAGDGVAGGGPPNGRPAVRFTREGAGERVVLEIDGSLDPEQAYRAEQRLLNLVTLFDPPSGELGVFLANGRDPRRSWTLTLTQLLIACQLVAVRDGLEAPALQPAGRRARAGNGQDG